LLLLVTKRYAGANASSESSSDDDVYASLIGARYAAQRDGQSDGSFSHSDGELDDVKLLDDDDDDDDNDSDNDDNDNDNDDNDNNNNNNNANANAVYMELAGDSDDDSGDSNDLMVAVRDASPPPPHKQ
jgi:hypothetical protein